LRFSRSKPWPELFGGGGREAPPMNVEMVERVTVDAAALSAI
jgi:hypothetical protein